MSRGPAQDRPIAERVRPGRVLAEYGVALSRLATEISTGTTVVLKELPAGEVPNAPSRGRQARRVDPADPADRDRVDGGVTRTLRPFVEGDTLDEVVRRIVLRARTDPR